MRALFIVAMTCASLSACHLFHPVVPCLEGQSACTAPRVCDEDRHICVDPPPVTPSCDAVPSSWTCPPAYYCASDGCDCGCGAPDPDCESRGCAGVNCCGSGVCTDDADDGAFLNGCAYCYADGASAAECPVPVGTVETYPWCPALADAALCSASSVVVATAVTDARSLNVDVGVPLTKTLVTPLVVEYGGSDDACGYPTLAGVAFGFDDLTTAPRGRAGIATCARSADGTTTSTTHTWLLHTPFVGYTGAGVDGADALAPANWSSGAVPTASDIVVVNGDIGTFPRSTTAFASGGLVLAPSATWQHGGGAGGQSWTIAGDALLAGTLTINSADDEVVLTSPSGWLFGTVAGTGRIVVGAAANIRVVDALEAPDATLQVGGVFAVDPRELNVRIGSLEVASGGAFRQSSGGLTLAGSFVADGEVSIDVVMTFTSDVRHRFTAPSSSTLLVHLSEGQIDFTDAATLASLVVDAGACVQAGLGVDVTVGLCEPTLLPCCAGEDCTAIVCGP